MPTISLYIRDEDWDKVRTIQESGKGALAQWLHEKLQIGAVGKVKTVQVEKSQRASGLVMEGTPAISQSTPEYQTSKPEQPRVVPGAPQTFGIQPTPVPSPPKKKIYYDQDGRRYTKLKLRRDPPK